MAPPSRIKNYDNKRKNGKTQTWIKTITNFYETYLNFEFLQRLIFDPSLLWISAIFLLAAEIFVNILVIEKVKYTEIDWVAYMEEVEGVVNGTWDYSLLKGQTGPLVYPAGFVYIFTILYYITSYGKNIYLAQYIFFGFYLLTLSLVFRIYSKSKKVPPYALIFICCTSYRIHSIYILRLFNDPVAMLFLYASINFFLDNQWSLGSILFSLAVSIKMNVLLFAPALLLAYIASRGIYGTIKQLAICASIQLILGAPFLLTNPVAYLRGSFDFGRVFLFEWTVNWRFLPEDIFVYHGFHLLLLLVHLAVLGMFSSYWWRLMKSFGKLQIILQPNGMGIVSQLFILPLFTANLIGVALSRSLHYQFYVWYFHSLPYLLWCTPFSVWARIAILGCIELSWNTFPSTSASSAVLHICHLLILIGLFIRSRSTNKDLNSPVDSKIHDK